MREIPIYGDLILAPMDGFSDLPFRSLCRRFGSAMSYTPFVNAMELLAGARRAWRELAFLTEERPVVFQIYDSDERRLLEAALRVQELGPDVIDVNMGCSTRSVSGRGAGAGLLRDPAKVGRIIRMLSRSLEIPVTAKIRLGWDPDRLTYMDVARAVEDNGGALIAVHARTRAQGYKDAADWDAIAAIRGALTIPVVGNGDVSCVEDIERMKSHTGCDAVMIGRAAIGNPWIFQRRDRSSVPRTEVAAVMRDHLDRMAEHYGDELAIVLFRKHMLRYLEPILEERELRTAILRATERRTLDRLLEKAGLPAQGWVPARPAVSS